MKVYYVEIKNETVRCEYSKRKNSKSIRIRVQKTGIVMISLPYYTPYLVARNFVKRNINWIEKKLDLLKLQKNTYYYLGNNISLIKKSCANIKDFNYKQRRAELTIYNTDDNLSIEKLYHEWLKIKAIEYIPYRVEELAKKYGFDFKSVNIKDLTSRWGSCSSKGNLSFNLKLMYFDYNIIDYVIVHELCHLSEMNHSKKFWKLVGDILPNYKECMLPLRNVQINN